MSVVGRKRIDPDVPTISVWRASLGISAAAWQLLGGPDRVDLLFDRRAGVIGVRAAAAGSRNAYAVRSASHRLHEVHAAAYIDTYNIPAAATLPAHMEGDILCAPLPKGDSNA